MKKKVLLMGASGSGKTSMRSLIFSNNPASLTARLGATIDVEQNHVRFLGDLILNLWDCGGQDSYMDTYLSTQRSTIFQQVGVMIYVFDVESVETMKDLEYFRECLDSLQHYSPEAAIFLLIHKMDLVRDRQKTFHQKKKDLDAMTEGTEVSVFGTSIYDESLYKAWSNIVNTLIPNAAILSRHLSTVATACNATEVILFERTTFLVIATSSSDPSSHASPDPAATSATAELDPKRYERTSELIKAFKYSCTRAIHEEFRALEMEMYDFTAVLDELTRNTYVMVIVHDPTIQAAALKMNIRLARLKFEQLQDDSLV